MQKRTITMSDDVFREVQRIRGKHFITATEDLSFSAVLEMVVRCGLDRSKDYGPLEWESFKG